MVLKDKIGDKTSIVLEGEINPLLKIEIIYMVNWAEHSINPGLSENIIIQHQDELDRNLI